MVQGPPTSTIILHYPPTGKACEWRASLALANPRKTLATKGENLAGSSSFFLHRHVCQCVSIYSVAHEFRFLPSVCRHWQWRSSGARWHEPVHRWLVHEQLATIASYLFISCIYRSLINRKSWKEVLNIIATNKRTFPVWFPALKTPPVILFISIISLLCTRARCSYMWL